MSGTQTLIDLKQVSFFYPEGPAVLKDLDLQIKAGDKIGLVAPNGSGKTTLFHLIMGLITPAAGRIKLFGQSMRTEKDFAGMRHKIGLLFQDSDDQLFSPTVIEDVAFGPLNMGQSKNEALARSRKTLAQLGLEGFENRITFKLSGGEKRLVALATILVMAPKVLLLDEPTAGLDEKTKTRLQALLGQLDLASIVISHEFDFLTSVTDRIHNMENGCIRTDEALHIHVHRHAHKIGQQPHRHV